MLPNLGPAELILILAIALIVFGPKKLPEIGKGIGQALREFNKARNDFMESINSEVTRMDPEPSRYPEPEVASLPTGAYPTTSPVERKLEYPEPLAMEHADALP